MSEKQLRMVQACIGPNCPGPDGEGRKCVACGGCCNWPHAVHWTEEQQQRIEPGAVVSVRIDMQWLTAAVGWCDSDGAVLDGWWRFKGGTYRYRVRIGFEECGVAMLRMRGEALDAGGLSGGCLGLELRAPAPKQEVLL